MFVEWRRFWVISVICILSLIIVVTISAMPTIIVSWFTGPVSWHPVDHTIYKIVYIFIFVLVGIPI